MVRRPTLNERAQLCTFCGFYGREEGSPFCDPCWANLSPILHQAWEELAVSALVGSDQPSAIFGVLLRASHVYLAITHTGTMVPGGGKE